VYANYFGLKEPSFSITPDPRYLYLTEQHREALAHLIYGAGENGGFVLLTGEVGTGKTTVCRAFLEQLPEQVDVALILHPALSATELLRTICDEFRIPVAEDERSVKRLLDRLNHYLLQAHAKGRRPVLMIDEAQDLSPRVLEQIRLLTNLETPKHKLLQIFLIGQPELREILLNPGLRQLNQRITARYHLKPFEVRDTIAYVEHRLAVAGVERPLFTSAALRQLHRLSQGVPRLINIYCDRALLGAAITRSPIVTRRILDKAVAEVEGGQPQRGISPAGARGLVLTAILMLGIGVGWGYWDYAGRPELRTSLATLTRLIGLDAAGPSQHEAIVASSVPDEPPTTAPNAVAPPDQPMAKSDTERFNALVATGELFGERETALRLLLGVWKVELGQLKDQDACQRLSSFGLECVYDQGGWSRLRDNNLPVLLHLRDKQGRGGWTALIAMDENQATLELPSGKQSFALATLDSLWQGDYMLVWQPPPVGGTIIRPGTSGEAVRWLRQLLSQIPGLGFKDDGSNRYDNKVGDAVKLFQTQSGLDADGIAGPYTLIRLSSTLKMPGLPKLRSGD